MCEGKSQILYVVSSPQKQFWYIPPLGVHLPPTASDELITSNRWTMKCGWTKQTWEIPMDWNSTSALSLWAPAKKSGKHSFTTAFQSDVTDGTDLFWHTISHHFAIFWSEATLTKSKTLKIHKGKSSCKHITVIKQSTRYQQVWLASSLWLTIMIHYGMISISG